VLCCVVCRRDPDLLHPLSLREDPRGGRRLEKQQGEEETYVQGLSEFCVKSVEETFELLRTAERNRKTRETDMNSFSSRSHSIFQVS
jgi:Kinesin motor domain